MSPRAPKPKCPKCSTTLSVEDRFCRSCGADMLEVLPHAVDVASSGGEPGESAGVAGFWLRLAAWLLDSAILAVLLVAVGFLIGYLRPDLFSADGTTTPEVNLLLNVTGLALSWLYYAYQESGKHQATFGKRAVGIRVTDESLGRISFGRATGRFASRILSGLLLFIGYLMAAWTKRKQALHDLIAGTLVVKVPRA